MQRVWQPINKTAGESKWLKLHILNIVLTGDTDYIVAYQILKFDLFGKTLMIIILPRTKFLVKYGR